ncbi:drug/metabolite transporter (DMT)-like permease [Sphingomonas sp. SORGH_AS802]|jgi:drug/metabolite transporter (DMT)-like permease|uniref:DMT family transporter n=1 Tax=unclassified Sphingomonas TaxID=196159 RepID=UPI00285A765A|nr:MULTISPECIES: EamA family transporter [unclassified Sphingomonas]MDR6128244.1 drug/metabolite transporter (DMT)-like permease [Sphingomonas sp. SORGH_AS_0438]MDR6135552.1 drug/metabolite transporter (DMT)-like permease [Sphingomonas sp. SORGH_AS_0802]
MIARPQSTRARILIPFAIVTLIWGSTWLVIRDQISVVPASWSVTYRFLLAGLAMLAFARAKGERVRLDAAGWLFAVAVGTLQFVLNFNFVYRAEAFITSGLVAVVFALLLVPNALLARLFLGQRLGRQLLVGSGIAMAGVALLFVHEVRSDPHGPATALTGIGWTLLAILSASCANVLQATRTAKRYPMLPTLAMAMLIGAGLDAVFAFLTVGPPVVEMRIGYLLGILYLALFASALAFPLYYGVLRVIGPAKAAYSSVIVPVIAMLLSTLFENYRWSPLAAGGAALAGAGLVVALTARRPAR